MKAIRIKAFKENLNDIVSDVIADDYPIMITGDVIEETVIVSPVGHYFNLIAEIEILRKLYNEHKGACDRQLEDVESQPSEVDFHITVKH